MARSRRLRAALALMATTTLLLTSACSNDEPSSGGELYKDPVTLTWWHNASDEGPGKQFWQKVANDFKALHPT
ncbi:MAG TPA: hypothetical protein VF062_29945, partial [Candidatus Limnocylindrales bacterium]